MDALLAEQWDDELVDLMVVCLAVYSAASTDVM